MPTSKKITPDSKNENWRFSKIPDLSAFRFTLPSRERGDVALIKKSVADFPVTAQAVFENDALLDAQGLPENLEKQGVVWESLEQAANTHAALFKKCLAASPPVSLGSEKIAALRQSRDRAGMLLYVPKGVEIDLPLVSFHWLRGENVAAFPHTFIIAEAGSKVTVVDMFSSADLQSAFSCGASCILAGGGAQVSYFALQNRNEKTIHMQQHSCRLEKDAAAQSFFFNAGGSFSRVESVCELAGESARSEMLAVSIGKGRQVFDQRSVQLHAAPRAWSNLLYKNVLNDHAKSVFQGLIRVEPNAAQTDAYQSNRSLLISPDAEADSIPQLEILNDDVKCSHGSSSGPLDEEQLFYMKTRGLTEEQAGRLLALGFFEEVLNKIKNQAIAQTLRKKIAAKLT
ncbi:MAG: Fe-S cluster assembly protein SufD [bacterium]